MAALEHIAPAVQAAFNLAELLARIDLPAPDDRDHLIRILQDRRADQLAALLARDPDAVPTAAMVHLRSTRWAEIEACEAALTAMSEPFSREDTETEEPA